MGADNQQERLDAYWVAGFVDGEGCFYVAINRQRWARWQVLPEFRIVQHRIDEQILTKLQSFFGCGKVTINHGDRKELRIRGLENLNKVVKFFESYPLKTKKKRDFEIFAEIVELMNRKVHLTQEGINKIANLAWQMNRQTKPKYLESSETTCRTSARMKI